MKNILFLCCCLLIFSFSAYSQKITYKDLLGEWDVDTANNAAGMWLKFTDSTQVNFSFGQVSNFTYTLDTSSTLTLLHLRGDSKKLSANIYWFIKMPDSNTLKLQGNFKGIKPTDWDDNETPANTGILKRRKS